MKKKRSIRCPQCSKETHYDENPFRPFCSDRCKTLDLGAWADTAYRLPDHDENEGIHIENFEDEDEDQNFVH